MAGGSGGAWKVAYADFVTAMMAFFMVMWLVGQDDKKKEAVADYFKDPWAKSTMLHNDVRNPTMREPRAGETDPGKKYSGSNPAAMPHDDPEALEKKKPKLVTIRAPERTTAGTIVNFGLNQTTLGPEGQKKLDDVLSSLKGLALKIDIRGHVSPSMNLTATEDSVWHMSYQRCLAVMHYLEELGIEPERMRLSVAGPFEPLTMRSQDSTDDRNARVEVFLLQETVGKFQGSANEIAESLYEEVPPDEFASDHAAPADAHGHEQSHGHAAEQEPAHDQGAAHGGHKH